MAFADILKPLAVENLSSVGVAFPLGPESLSTIEALSTFNPSVADAWKVTLTCDPDSDNMVEGMVILKLLSAALTRFLSRVPDSKVGLHSTELLEELEDVELLEELLLEELL